MLLPHHSLLTYNSKKEAWKRKKPKLLLNALVMPRHVFAPGLRPKVRGMSSSWNCPKTLNWMGWCVVVLVRDFMSPTLFLNVDKPMVMECGWRDSSRIILTMRRVGELHHPFIFCVVWSSSAAEKPECLLLHTLYNNLQQNRGCWNPHHYGQ